MVVVTGYFIIRTFEWDAWTEYESMGGMLGCTGELAWGLYTGA